MNLSLRPSTASGAARFYWHDPESLLLVRATIPAGVVICTAQDNLTPEQQEGFIRYLWAEGFITADSAAPDCFDEREPSQERIPVRWIIDSSRPKVDPSYALHIRRLSWCLLGILVVWLGLMTALICW